MAMRRFLGGAGVPGDSMDPGMTERDTETVRRISRELEALPVERARFLAAFAYILTRAAAADLCDQHRGIAHDRAARRRARRPAGAAGDPRRPDRAQPVAPLRRHGGLPRHPPVPRALDARRTASRCCAAATSWAPPTTRSRPRNRTCSRRSRASSTSTATAVNVIRNEFAPKLAAIQAMLRLRGEA